MVMVMIMVMVMVMVNFMNLLCVYMYVCALPNSSSQPAATTTATRPRRNGIPEPPEFYVNAFSTNLQIKERSVEWWWMGMDIGHTFNPNTYAHTQTHIRS